MNIKSIIMKTQFQYHTEWLTKQYVAKLESIFEGHEFTNISWKNDLCDTIEMDGMIAIMLPNSVFCDHDNEEFTMFTIRCPFGNHDEIVSFAKFDEMVEFILNKLLLGTFSLDSDGRPYADGESYWFLSSDGVAIKNPNKSSCGRFYLDMDRWLGGLEIDPQEYYRDPYLKAHQRIEFTLANTKDTI
jgi:hypothetical protein